MAEGSATERPLVSVVVPVYNVEKYLDRCVESIVGQTYDNLEIILVNDGSPDNSGAICEKWRDADSRVVYVVKENGGLSDARNAGVAAATGEYVGFVDSDDYIAPDTYEVMLREMREYDADLAMFGVADVYADHTDNPPDLGVRVMTPAEALRDIFLNETLMVGVPPRLYPAWLVREVTSPVGRTHEDAFIVVDLLSKVNRIVVDSKPRYFYVHNEGTITSDPAKRARRDNIDAWEHNRQLVQELYPEIYDDVMFRCYWAHFDVLDGMLLAGLDEAAGTKDGSLPAIPKAEIVDWLVAHKNGIVAHPAMSAKRKLAVQLLAVNEGLYKGLVMLQNSSIKYEEGGVDASASGRKRVGFFVSSLADMGGAIRVSVSIANRMVEDYDVVIFELTGHDEIAFPLDSRIDVVPLGSKQERFRGRVGEVGSLMREALKKHPVDVMLGIGAEETGVAIAPCLGAKVPLVFCDHGALVNQLDDKTTTMLRRICSAACPVTVTLTMQTYADYMKIFHVPGRKLMCIPNWIPSALFEKAAGYDAGVKKILWAGRLDHEKGVDHLYDIAKRVLPSHPDWTWDVYGKAILGTEEFDIAAAIEADGLSGQMNLMGQVDDMYDRYATYSIGTLTSYREGLPLFLLEGKACGLPCVSFDVDTGPRDIVVDGVDGYLVEPYDCAAYAARLEELMESEELRAKMSAAGREDAKRFSEDAIYEKWVTLIERF